MTHTSTTHRIVPASTKKLAMFLKSVCSSWIHAQNQLRTQCPMAHPSNAFRSGLKHRWNVWVTRYYPRWWIGGAQLGANQTYRNKPVWFTGRGICKLLQLCAAAFENIQYTVTIRRSSLSISVRILQRFLGRNPPLTKPMKWLMIRAPSRFRQITSAPVPRRPQESLFVNSIFRDIYEFFKYTEMQIVLRRFLQV